MKLTALLLCLALGSAGVALADGKTPPTSGQTQSVVARAPSGERVATSKRCQGITKKGLQCKRNAKPGTSYCYQHGG